MNKATSPFPATRSLVLAFCLQLFLSLSAYSQVIAPENRLWLGEMSDDSGLHTGQLQVINTGADTLTVESIRPDCACTEAEISTDRLAPGDTATVQITFNPQASLGEFNKKVTVVFSSPSPATQSLVLRVAGTVTMSEATLLRRYPHAIDLGKGEDGEQSEEGQPNSFLFNTLEVNLKGTPSEMAALHTYNHSKTPVAIVITDQPKFIKAKPLLDPINPGQTCVILIEVIGEANSQEGTATMPRNQSQKIEGQIIDAATTAVLAPFTITLTQKKQ